MSWKRAVLGHSAASKQWTTRVAVAIVDSVHPEHDEVSREVRRWYNSAVPEIGLDGAAHWFGFACMIGADQARVVLSIDDPAEVPAALAAARAACAAGSFMVMVDDRDRAARLDAALRAHGCSYDESTTFLALTGPMVSPAPGPGQLEVARIGTAELQTWARVKLQSFADSEDAPAAAAVTAEVAGRRGELPLAEYQLGILDGEPVAVLAHYPGADDLVFILGTRTPYRHRGIAQSMLARWAAAAAGRRSMIINATEGGAPAALYRRLGFTDEVYWYSRYELSPADPTT
jgi:GNAT superfamily N-acetyltransferase